MTEFYFLKPLVCSLLTWVSLKRFLSLQHHQWHGVLLQAITSMPDFIAILCVLFLPQLPKVATLLPTIKNSNFSERAPLGLAQKFLSNRSSWYYTLKLMLVLFFSHVQNSWNWRHIRVFTTVRDAQIRRRLPPISGLPVCLREQIAGVEYRSPAALGSR